MLIGKGIWKSEMEDKFLCKASEVGVQEEQENEEKGQKVEGQ